jgi:hypothetical protein
MPLTFLLLQTANVALAAATLWIRFRNPLLWDDQAIVLATCGGMAMASLTAILLGLSLMFRSDSKMIANLANLFLTLACAGLQGYFLLAISRELGLFQMLKTLLG